MIELSKLKPLDGATIEIIHPVLKDIGVSFTVYGSESKEYRQATNDTMLKRMMSEGKPSREELENDELDILVSSIKSFKGVTVDGVELESNDENKRMLLTDVVWIRDQISSFIMTRTNFFLKG